MRRSFLDSAARGVRLAAVAGVLFTAVADFPAHGQAPPQVTGVYLDENLNLVWNAAAGATTYNVYRSLGSRFTSTYTGDCFATGLTATTLAITDSPPPGDFHTFLVTGQNTAGESSPGAGKRIFAPCAREKALESHTLRRLGYGVTDAERSAIAASGIYTHILAQLQPETIDESTNTAMNGRLAGHTPPASLSDLILTEIVHATYAKRQLQEQLTYFWDNHFNTDWNESRKYFNGFRDPNGVSLFTNAEENAFASELEYRGTEQFRSLAMGKFSDLLIASATSPTMIIFLDNVSNRRAAPNENYAREAMELHTMGVNGGYTQTDVEQLARCFTGWSVCRKPAATAGDPLSACLTDVTDPSGVWAFRFNTAQHDTAQKTLFAGTPQQIVIPARPAAQGLQDGLDALAALASHPSTRRFIASKLIKRFVSDTAPAPLVDAAEATWIATGGDMREVMRTILLSPDFLAAANERSKIRTPVEYVAYALRALRSDTNGTTQVQGALDLMQEYPYTNPVPTGFSEAGSSWIDTNGLLQRQKFAIDLALGKSAGFASDVMGLLGEHGLTTADQIVDFYLDLLLGGDYTPAQRQAALTFITTANDGVSPGTLTETRIRQTVGVILGFPQANEQ